PAVGLLDHGDRRLEPEPVLFPGLGIARRAREEMGRVPERPGMDRQARRDRARRPDRRHAVEPAARADLVLLAEVSDAGVPRGLDHIVHAVRDLDAAADLYRRLGFLVGARNRHPPGWGTENHIVQFPGVFVELLTVAEPAGIAPRGERFFSFGAHNRDFLALSMLVLEGRGDADAQAFRAAGIGDFEVFNFE